MSDYSKVTMMEYQKKKLEMLTALGSDGEGCSGLPCAHCPLGKEHTCTTLETDYPEKALQIVMEFEPPVDWTKVPVDAKILVHNCIGTKWVARHFAKYKDGKVYTWRNGTTVVHQ